MAWNSRSENVKSSHSFTESRRRMNFSNLQCFSPTRAAFGSLISNNRYNNTQLTKIWPFFVDNLDRKHFPLFGSYWLLSRQSDLKFLIKAGKTCDSLRWKLERRWSGTPATLSGALIYIRYIKTLINQECWSTLVCFKRKLIARRKSNQGQAE